jgi:putative endonuclease
MKDSRRSALRLGHHAEWLAAGFLMLKGYRLVARNYGGTVGNSSKGGEIDLIMRKGDVIAFIEVKARRETEMALTAVTPGKIRLVSRTVRLWLTRNPWANGLTWRGDIVAVSGWRKPVHLEAAFEIEMR